MSEFIPIMLKAKGLRCVVIGGGPVAERKCKHLLSAGAEIKLISPAVTEPLRQAAHEGSLIWYNRKYVHGDLSGADLAYSAVDQASVNEQVADEAAQLRIPVNVSGPGSGGTFISPSVVRRGGLVIAVSTSGAGPAAARRISKEIENMYGSEYEIYMDFLNEIRSKVKATVNNPSKRHELLKAVAEMDILSDIRDGRFEPWSERQIIAWIQSYNT